MKSKRDLKLSEMTIHRTNKNKTMIGSVDLKESEQEMYRIDKENFALTMKGMEKIRKFLG